jgi:uncharacterized protein YcbK (DUF882 family)
MTKLSPHFSASEFECRCCGRLPDKGIPIALINGLEELRAAAGGKPVRILSGYRCKHHNHRVGGAKRSQHLFGRAADIVIGQLFPYQVVDIAKGIQVFHDGGIGQYSNFTHVDVRGVYGQHRARWG